MTVTNLSVAVARMSPSETSAFERDFGIGVRETSALADDSEVHLLSTITHWMPAASIHKRLSQFALFTVEEGVLSMYS